MRIKAPNESLFPRVNTLRFKISILYIAVIGFVLLLFQGVLYFNYVNSMSKAFDAQLQMKAEQIGGAVNTFRGLLGQQRQALTLAAQKALNLSVEYPKYVFMPDSSEKFWLADAKKLGLDKDYLVIMDTQGEVITKSRNVTENLLLYFERIGRLNLNKNKFYKVNFNKNILQVVLVPYYYAYRQGYIIAVGTPYEPIERVLRQHLWFIIASTSVFLAIASLMVRFFVIRVLSSVMEISNAARNISQDNLHARIKVTDADGEIKHLTGSLNNMIERLEASFTHIKDFSLEMAHEVKTPLAIISGESQLALEKDRGTEEYKGMLSIIFKEAQRTQKFVSDLLLLTKLDYRLIQLKFDPIDLAAFLREICEEMQVITASKGVMIHQDIAHEPLSIYANKTHLERVFFNLIDNALRFTPPGGGIRVTAKGSDQKAVVSVSDTGRGISQEELSGLFNKFYRVGADDQKADSGGGLGLKIVYSIIAYHGGNVSVQSELGKGTTFRVELPLIE